MAGPSSQRVVRRTAKPHGPRRSAARPAYVSLFRPGARLDASQIEVRTDTRQFYVPPAPGGGKGKQAR